MKIKNKLRFEEVSYFKVDSSDLENLIKEVYKKEYDMIGGQEWSNDTQHSFKNIKGNLSKFDKEELKDFTEGKESFCSLNIILNDLVKNNHIPAGSWLVTVCW